MGKVWDVLAPRNLELGPLAGPVPRAAASAAWRNWMLARDEDDIAWLVLHKPGASANTLSEEVLAELNDALANLERGLPRGVVLRSAKPAGFIAGADINEFGGMTDVAAIEARLTQAHAVVDRLDNLGAPTVAIIHGYCLGGGLEIALACDYRIAVDDARLGFPEVMLGLHPGLGGLFGTIVNSHYGRALAAKRMRTETAKKAPIVHYPAPHALIDLWEKHGGNAQEMQRAEIASFARLIVSDTSRNLVRVFFLREKLKGLAKGDWSPRRVHVIGAGAMGGDIAAWCAWHGFSVTLADTQEAPIAKAMARAAELYGKISHKRIDTRDALDRLMPDLDGEGVRSADLVIEAVPEKLDLKRKVYAATEPKMKAGAILATNTSSIPLEELRVGLRRPNHLVGLHFFNPVSRMQLVEVVSHDQVWSEVLLKARAFLGRIDRLPAPVRSAPGFLVNRALTPYMLEALVMLGEGYKRETIDAAAQSFGMPMGPIELADTVGLDICLHVAETLKASLARPMPDVSQALRAKAEAGHLGRKSGRGFYEWKRGEAGKERDAPKSSQEMTARLIWPMLDVCVTCLREGVVADEDTVDGAMVFATGFAPFRGGPMHYGRSRGNIRAELERLAQHYGDRFRPDPGWDRFT